MLLHSLRHLGLTRQRLQELLDKPQPLFALVLSPTRELAIQIAGQFEALGSTIGVRCAALVGGIDMMQQAIALGKRPHILVGTPGRVVDHLSNTKVHKPVCIFNSDADVSQWNFHLGPAENDDHTSWASASLEAPGSWSGSALTCMPGLHIYLRGRSF